MTKDKKTLVPALRFPEFKDAGEWEQVKLGHICDVIGGGTPDTKEDSYWNGDILWLIPSEICNNKKITDSKRKITFSGLKNSSAKLLPVGTIVLTSRATIGEMGILNVEAATNQGFQSLVVKKGTSCNYIYYLQDRIKKLCFKYAKGSTFLEVSGASIKNFIIPIPSYEEQQKIADCLGSLDDLINAMSDKVEALKEHKKGLMQQLFPAEGETTPALRFPEFKDAGEWEEKGLGEVCNITNGKSNAQDHIEGGMYPLFDRSEVIKSSNSYLFDCEAVIIPGEGMRFIPKYYKGKFNLHQRAYALNNFSCIGLYVYYFMEHISDLLALKAVKSTVLSLRLPILQKFSIHIANNPNEQQKIADCLGSLDDLISAMSDKVEALKKQKKGLMQRLFPIVND